MSRPALFSSAVFLLASSSTVACVSSNSGGTPPTGPASDSGAFDASIPNPFADGGSDGSSSGGDDGATPTGDAGPEAILVPTLGAGFDYHQGSYDLGWYFVVNTPLTVTALGFYDDKMDGLTASHPVAIYDKATQSLLAQATVSPSDPLTGYFRYTPLTPPLALEQGHTYVLVTLVGSENYLAFDALDPAWTVNPAITYTGGAVNYANASATTLLYPDTFGTAGGDFGPNFQLTTP